MALFGIMGISAARPETENDAKAQARNAFIIDQIKRPEECDLFRKVYGEHYVQISCHADEPTRIDSLTAQISEGHPEDPKSTKWDLAARSLVHQDESEEGEKYGQRVRQVFPLSDVIINASSPESARKGLERFLRALFGDKSVTPTREEFGMELANTAAQRSSDLSRQVGAAILTRNMEVQAVGCNEVPCARGGAYWEGDTIDGRDFALGKDANYQRRQAVLKDLLLRLKDIKLISDEKMDALKVGSELSNKLAEAVADSQLMDSLEYGRSVHAEMAAITDAARVGNAISGCTLFSNTFPCHNCAKHIVAAGITKVIYNHPYPKSYAKELFADSIVVNPIADEPNRVIFKQFIGILGPMYGRLFTKARWKSEQGVIPAFEKRHASYIRRTRIPAYERVEQFLLEKFIPTLTNTFTD